jgi:hypothetical protein
MSLPQPDATKPSWFGISEEERARIIDARRERKAARTARDKRINRAIMSGRKVDEIAEVEGISSKALYRLAKRRGYALSDRRGQRFVSTWIPDALSSALDEFSLDMKTDPRHALAEILKWVLDNNAERARLALRVKPRAKELETAA